MGARISPIVALPCRGASLELLISTLQLGSNESVHVLGGFLSKGFIDEVLLLVQLLYGDLLHVFI